MCRKIFYCLFVTIILTFFCFSMSSCTLENTDVVFDMDTQDLWLTVPSSIINFQDDLSDAISVSISETTADIIIDMSWLGSDIDKTSEIKHDLKRLFPSLATTIETLCISANKEYFGTSLFGTEYYTFDLQFGSDIDFDLVIVSSSPIMIGGTAAEQENDRYVISSKVSISNGQGKIAVDRFKKNYKSCRVDIDISDTTPFVTYTIVPSVDNLKNIKEQVMAMGMKLESDQSNAIIFTESFETVNDFQYVFPIRLFSMFHVVNTASVKASSFFSDDCKSTFTFVDEMDSDIVIRLIGQENTNFEVFSNEKKIETTSSEIEVPIQGSISIQAQYSNMRLFATITSLLMFIAIALVIFAMIFIARQRFRR